MSFINIPNTTTEIRSILYDILATYNIILLDYRKIELFEMITKEYKNLKLPNLGDKDFNTKLSSILNTEWNVSLKNVIESCKEDNIFPEIINYLEENTF